MPLINVKIIQGVFDARQPRPGRTQLRAHDRLIMATATPGAGLPAWGASLR